MLTLKAISLRTSHPRDDSYTPSKVSIRAGTGVHDLQEVGAGANGNVVRSFPFRSLFCPHAQHVAWHDSQISMMIADRFEASANPHRSEVRNSPNRTGGSISP